jgi:hypothetical protein
VVEKEMLFIEKVVKSRKFLRFLGLAVALWGSISLSDFSHRSLVVLIYAIAIFVGGMVFGICPLLCILPRFNSGKRGTP